MTAYVYRGTNRDIYEPPQRHRANTAQCGTDSGYYRHLRTTRTPPCEACRKAHAAYERSRRRPHVCATCPDCIHDGHKCCGCYDGACCKADA